MSTLYRCRTSVAYKPYKSNELIFFEERQVQEAFVKLKWDNTLPSMASQGSSAAAAYASGLTTSSCQVVLADPYLSGPAWLALFDAASMYTFSSMAEKNNILLPICEDGQDPLVNKCRRSQLIDESGLVSVDGASQVVDSMSHLLISFWYEVNGTRFGTDYYFKVNKISVGHGSATPSVTISGVDARSIVFNQNLVNMRFNEGTTVDEALKKIAEESGFRANFCVSADGEKKEPYVFPRTVTYKGITPDEAFKKVLKASGGTMLSLPTREFEKNISVCSRGELYQGCTVFYLGRGLYESYQINGEPPTSLLERAAQDGSTVNSDNPYPSESFDAKKYKISEIGKKTRAEDMKGVKQVKFPELFTPCEKRCLGPASDGMVWKGKGPVVTQESLKSVNLFGIAPNGTTAISFLSGKVRNVSKETGTVLITTNFWIDVCAESDDKKCFSRWVHQETTNLTDVDVEAKDTVTISQKIGTSTGEKKEFTRFLVYSHNGTEVTIDPELVWALALPEKLADEKAAKASTPNQPTTPASAASPPPPGSSSIVGKVGSTGRSTGPHVHVEWENKRPITEADATRYVSVPGYTFTSGYRPADRPNHTGVDLAAPEGTPVTLINGARALNSQLGYSEGYGNNVLIATPEGNMLLGHFQDGTIPSDIKSVTSSGTAGKSTPAMASGPSTTALTVETSFVGVPRALRITPGRTILSFVTDYDKWIEEEGHKGQPTSTDPGVWIADRFRSWFVREAAFNWRQGNMRVDIEGANAWGTTRINAPTFKAYMSAQKRSGEFSITNDYYGYIRSVGSLCFPLVDPTSGKSEDSCSKICKEAQELAAFLNFTQGGDESGGGSVTGNYPAANCQTGDPTKDLIINALYSVGINTQNAFAGVLGNFQAESGIQANRHNLPNPGTGCSSTTSGPLGPVGYGIAQWCGSRQTNIFNKCGRTSNLGCELEFMVSEIRGKRDTDPNLVGNMNSAGSPSAAADAWNAGFERGPGGIQKRRDAAVAIAPSIKCDKPAP